MFKLTQKIRAMISKPAFPQFVKFCVVGVLNTVIFYVIYYVMLLLGFFYAVAAAVGTIIGVINSYIWNKFYVFKSSKKSPGEIIKFLVVYGVQYVSNVAVIYLMVTFVGISAELAGLFAVGVGVFISFLGHKFWSFRK